MNWKKRLKKFFLSKHPDGRSKAGLGIFMLPLIPFFGIIIWLRMSSASIAKNEAMKGKGVSASQISDAVKSTSEVRESEDDTPKIESERDLKSENSFKQVASPAPNEMHASAPLEEAEPAGSTGEINALDRAARLAQTPVEKERPVIREIPTMPGAVKLGDTASVPVEESGQRDGPRGSIANTLTPSGGEGGNFSIDALIAYKRKPTPEGTTKKPAAQQPYPWGDGLFLPRGQNIPLYLLETIRTDDVQPIIICGVARDVLDVKRERVIIPFGTRLLISVNAGPDKGQRVVATPSSFQFPDGSELAVAGVIKGYDKMTGLPSYYIPPPTWVQMSAYVNDFLSGYLGLIYEKQQMNTQLSIGGVTVGQTQPTFDPKMEAISATSEVIRDYAKQQMTELQARYAPYLVVPAGTPCYMTLTSPLTVTKRGMDVAPMASPVPDRPQSSDNPLMPAALNGAKSVGSELSAQAARLGM